MCNFFKMKKHRNVRSLFFLAGRYIIKRHKMQMYAPTDLLCNSIINVNKNIQSVVIINKMGRPIEKTSKPKFANQFADCMNEIFFMQCVLQISIGKDFDEKYGPINYHISERTSHTILTFPAGENVILVITNKNVSPIALARKIAVLIGKDLAIK